MARKITLFYAKDKDIDQPVHPFCLISTFVIHSLEGLIAKLAILNFQYYSEALLMCSLDIANSKGRLSLDQSF